MDRLADAIIRHRKAVIIIFMAAAVICALLFTKLVINYDMAEYLPPDAQSTKALQLLNREFDKALPNAQVEVWDLSLMEALEFKRELAGLPHISDVLWLDDLFDLLQPLEIADQDTHESYYRDGTAYYQATVIKGNEKEGIREIRNLLKEKGTVTGEAAEIEFVQAAAGREVANAMFILLPLILLILLLSTTSWLEPLLFLAAIGMSVVINMGTNALFGSVSFLTNAVTPILQLAVSLDYAIFLLHSFAKHRQAGAGVDIAMREAVKESFSSVAASATTTLFGFMALLFMQFGLGADLGLSLAKGIAFSFISVMIFLPALTICVHKTLEKTRHREIMPTFSNIHNILRRISIPAVLVVAVIIVPCFLGQSQTDFLYGYQAAFNEMTGKDTAAAESRPTPLVLLVPKGDIVKEELLSKDLLALPYISSVISYAKTVGPGIPAGFLDSSITEQFYSEHFARLVVYTDTPQEGETAFAAVEEISMAAEKYYPGEVYSVGQSANLYDIRTVVQNDNKTTNLIAIIAIFLVLLLTFRSALLPFFLLVTIETAIWINLSVPYFTNTSINYIGYLVLNTVQLGATVDYAILLTVTYMRSRRSLPKKEAIHQALGRSFRAILVSATIMAMAGFTLAGTSSNPLIADIGKLLGRGTLLSMIMVLVFLPAMLTIFDKAIGKTTYKAGFFAENPKIREVDVK
ncbi:MAG: MMPL family transporter [Clostridiales bacterium]|jgi:predicted RND superfamily exporter protein|nr:MMPL family transporter [Clostridiales bacterium]MDR2713013.1 MMPL family transporter [Clostridiales bacterium]